ncbi:helix-turn-helix transcriptional regulator [Gallibacterium anatis]|nr:helix-turn-helix domain-containing protein [Gallibacterium anatis]
METLKSSNAVNKQLLNIDEVRAITGFSTTTIYKYVKRGGVSCT